MAPGQALTAPYTPYNIFATPHRVTFTRRRHPSNRTTGPTNLPTAYLAIDVMGHGPRNPDVMVTPFDVVHHPRSSIRSSLYTVF